MRAAVPRYVGGKFSEAPPGHRFRMYFPVWDERWGIDGKGKRDALKQVVEMAGFRGMADALARRVPAGDDCLVVHARSDAPVVTGMGMEHPLENGFAFLDPYGLPYLPGAGIKGVLRRAAEELALFEEDPRGWSPAAVWWLFGFDAASAFFRESNDGDPLPVREEVRSWRRAFRERGGKDAGGLLSGLRRRFPAEPPVKSDGEFLQRLQEDRTFRRSIHLRGSLLFHDVVPVPGGSEKNLRVDVMNPHHGAYYRGAQSPHDAGEPNPIFFLAIPAGWSFTFHVRFRPVEGLPGWFRESTGEGPRWQVLLRRAFEHAFDWLGFGAKTSVGYGAMIPDQAAERDAREERERRQKEAEEQARREELEGLPPLERAIRRLETAGPEEFAKIWEELDSFQGDQLVELARALKKWMQAHDRWKVARGKKKWWERGRRLREILGEGT